MAAPYDGQSGRTGLRTFCGSNRVQGNGKGVTKNRIKHNTYIKYIENMLKIFKTKRFF